MGDAQTKATLLELNKRIKELENHRHCQFCQKVFLEEGKVLGLCKECSERENKGIGND